MAKAFDPKAKAKRQKIVAGVLGLVLVGVLVFQAPTIMSMFGGGSSTPASEPAATPPPAAPATPAPTTPGAPAPATPVPATPGGTASLVDSDPAPAPTDGQLVTFDRFESKDPFVQQIEDAPQGQTPAPSVPADTGEKAGDPEGQADKPAASPPAAAPAPAASNGARISVNGVEHDVKVKATFPTDDPIFRLVSLKDGVAKVAIVGGSYANGSQTIALKKGGKPVTLMNTADGTTFVLRYLG
jgi:hypothetical protein